MAKGYTVAEILTRRERGITGAGAKWEEASLAGNSRYAQWIEKWYGQICAVVAGLPSKEGKTIDVVVNERVKPVLKKTSAVAVEYRRDKVRQLATLITPTR
jgi:hypothetical protein